MKVLELKTFLKKFRNKTKNVTQIFFFFAEASVQTLLEENL